MIFIDVFGVFIRSKPRDVYLWLIQELADCSLQYQLSVNIITHLKSQRQRSNARQNKKRTNSIQNDVLMNDLGVTVHLLI